MRKSKRERERPKNLSKFSLSKLLFFLNHHQVRAKQYYSDDHDHSKSMGVLLHGDGE